MCQTVADALFLPENKWDIVRKTNVQTFVCREIGNILFPLLDKTEKAAIGLDLYPNLLRLLGAAAAAAVEAGK